MKLYRIQHKDSNLGMWNTKCDQGNPLVTYLSNKVMAEMPMPHNDRYGLHGRRWYSAANSLEQLDFWFNAKDIAELIDLGFEVFEIEADEYAVHDKEMIFTKESVTSMKNITQQFLLSNQKQQLHETV